MEKELKVGLFQADIIWEDIEANQDKISGLLSGLDDKPDLLVLPEMYTTGFTSNYDNLNISTVNRQLEWQLALSKESGVSILGSVLFFDNKRYRNRIFLTQPDSQYDYYDKRHLFQAEKENNNLEPGNRRVTINLKETKIMPQICYDLRFPVWSRNNTGYHILVYVANWPEIRSKIWTTLLKARAIENQCYVIGVNRVGADKNNIRYNGKSAVYGPQGEEILVMDHIEAYGKANLSVKELVNYREKFGAYKDSDIFEIKNQEY